MISSKRAETSRLNGQRSKGPVSPEAKARSATNSLQFGLSRSVLADPQLSKEVEALACQIAGGDLRLLGLARRVADAQVDLTRARQVRSDLISCALYDPRLEARNRSSALLRLFTKLVSTPSQRAVRGGSPTPDKHVASVRSPNETASEQHAAVLSGLSEHLNRLDRYERRALSRRKFAIRELDSARAEGGS